MAEATIYLTEFIFAWASDAPWWNIPSYEVWRVVNLAVFGGLIYFIAKKPLTHTLQARRENIRRELMRAQEEKAAAEAKLAEVNERFAKLDAEITAIRQQTEQESGRELERMQQATTEELEKILLQAQREIANTAKAARADLRKYAAEQSVELAGEMLRQKLRPEDDARLMREQVEQMGGLQK